MTSLRPYQVAALDGLRASLRSGHRAPVLVAPCGSGKTIIAKAIIDGAMAKGHQCLFLAPRRELIYQCSEKLTAAGIHHGIMMAGESMDRLAPVQVACVPTLHRRRARTYLPSAKVVICDEAHLFVSRMMSEILGEYPDAIKIGLTATPCRGDGRGLGEMFDDLVLGPSIPELIAGGYLVKPRYFAPSTPDLAGIKIQAGDYHQGQLGERMNKDALVGDVVDNWFRLAVGRQTIVFGVNVAHAMHLCQRFREAGVRAEHLDSTTPREERRDMLKRFEDGAVQLLTNCQIFSYGIDVPPASACVLAHPTKSLARYVQAVGRVLRPYAGKTDCLVIDHAGIIDAMGFVEDDFPWTLDGKESVQDRIAAVERKEPKSLTCPECATVFTGAARCPSCGHDMSRQRAKAMAEIEADLVEVKRKGEARQKREWTMAEKAAFYGELLGLAIERKYNSGWAAHKYLERLGVWPNAMKGEAAREPSIATRSWVKSRQIAHAKAMEKQSASV